MIKLCIKYKKRKELILKDIHSLSLLVRKLCLYCNFVSKSKSLDSKHIKNLINNIKIYIDNIEKHL